MNRKRKLIADAFRVKKRKSEIENGHGLYDLGENLYSNDVPNDTQAAVKYLASLFPRKLFNDVLPTIVLKHQLYSIVKDKTIVDRQLNELKDRGEIRMFQLGFASDTFGIVFTDDYKVKALAETAGKGSSVAVQKFLDTVLSSCSDISYSKEKMVTEHSFRDQEITQLVSTGVLTVRDAGSWWLGVPGIGRFVKYFVKGRKAILGMIRRTKYKEVLQSDMQSRKKMSDIKFGYEYHIHDIIGAGLVDCVSTSSGILLRLADK